MQPFPDFRNLVVHSLSELGLEFLEFSGHTLARSTSEELIYSSSVFPTYMREPEELKGFRLSLSSLESAFGRELAEFQNTGLFRV